MKSKRKDLSLLKRATVEGWLRCARRGDYKVCHLSFPSVDIKSHITLSHSFWRSKLSETHTTTCATSEIHDCAPKVPSCFTISWFVWEDIMLYNSSCPFPSEGHLNFNCHYSSKRIELVMWTAQTLSHTRMILGVGVSHVTNWHYSKWQE